MSACLHMIVTDMSEFLDVAQLRLILLNAIPERQVRDVYVSDPPRQPGLPYRSPAGRTIRVRNVTTKHTRPYFPTTRRLNTST